MSQDIQQEIEAMQQEEDVAVVEEAPPVEVKKEEVKTVPLVGEEENLFEGEVEEVSEEKLEVEAEDEKVIGSVVKRKLSPIEKELMRNRMEIQLERLLNGPDGDVYAQNIDKIRKYIDDPRLKGLTMKARADLAVGANIWRQRGAEQEKKAREEAAFSKGLGSGVRPSPSLGVVDFDKMSKQEFADYQEKVIGGRM